MSVSPKYRKEEAANLEKLKEVVKMTKSCEVQRNVNMTIKDGLKNLQSFIQEVLEKHKEVDVRDENMLAALDYAVNNRKERNQRQERKHAKALRHIVLKC